MPIGMGLPESWSSIKVMTCYCLHHPAFPMIKSKLADAQAPATWKAVCRTQNLDLDLCQVLKAPICRIGQVWSLVSDTHVSSYLIMINEFICIECHQASLNTTAPTKACWLERAHSAVCSNVETWFTAASRSQILWSNLTFLDFPLLIFGMVVEFKS